MTELRKLKGVISKVNSSAAPLGIGGVFTGPAEDVTDFGTSEISVYSDVASATNGLSIEYSTDGVNWDHTDPYTVPAATGKNYSVQRVAKWFRMVYTNGAIAQTVFRLQVIFNQFYIKPSSHRIQDSIVDEDDATLSKAVLTGLTPSGIFKNVLVTNAGNLKSSLEEFEATFYETPIPVTDNNLLIARGLRVGMGKVNKYGRATAGVQTTSTDIWDRADASATQQIWLAPTAPRVHTLVSSSTADDGTPEGAGAGAQAVRVWFLADWDTAEATEVVIMNGTTGVAMSASAVMINRMRTIPVGTTYAINVGDITATAAVDATVTAQISATRGQTLMAIYGIPSIQTGQMTNYDVNSHNTGNPSTVVETDFDLLVAEHPDLNPLAFTNRGNVGLIASGTSHFSKTYAPHNTIDGPAIIKFQAIATLADTEAVAEFDMIIVDN